MNKRTVVLALMLVLALVLTTSIAVAQEGYGSVVTRIKERGELICGANANLVGFGSVNDAGEFEGFDVDFCRAYAAAILGDSTAVNFRPLAGADRQAAIQSGEVDVMVRNTTYTLSRDVTWTSVFGPTNFYDGQGVMTLTELGVNSIAELDGTSMCVQTGTTTELNITDYIEANGLDIELQVYPDANGTWEAYVAGRCESWTTDKSGLVAYRATADNPAAHVVLPDTISKEPLGPLTPQSDEQLGEIVRWVTYGLIQAEEYGINSANIADFLPTEGEADEAYVSRVSPEVARFLGQANNDSGNYLGIANDFMVTVITQVGNYGEIYERHLTPLGLAREGSLNDLWTRGGLLYSPPFR